MSSSPLSFLLRHRRLLRHHHHHHHHHTLPRHLSTASSSSPDPRSNLSARLSFIFDQIDAIDRDRSRELADKDQALQRIRSWRHSNSPATAATPTTTANNQQDQQQDENSFTDFLKKEVEVVHPWPEWIELLERLGHQNYFDRRTSSSSADGGLAEEVREEVGFDFSRDWITVRNACINFGRDRFDILKSLPRKDLQVLVGHGCPSLDPKVVFSAKLLRKHVHLDEGDVCSSCSLRNSCGRGYILTRKEDEARTLDVMRILLTFGFDHVNGAVENKPLMKMKSVKTVVRKLLHEVVKLSAVPIDPNLPPPVIKKPPPKVKQPPPQPKKRVGRDDVEMKKGDWLCVKCDFMNFAKNTVCLQCDAKRPKRQLLPGEWECPQCNFLNYRRNMACFHCDAKRPEDEFTQNQFMERQSSPRTRMERPKRMQDVSDAWNFDFDDNESDGADVAAFEFADSAKVGKESALDDLTQGRSARGFEDDIRDDRKMPRSNERGRYFSDDDERESPTYSKRTGFDDFDDEDDVESYELDGSNNNQAQEVSRKNFSEVENTSGSEELDDFDRSTNFKQGADLLSGSEDDELSEQPHWKSSHIADSWQKSRRKGGKSPGSDVELDSDYDDDDDMDVEDRPRLGKNHKQNSHGKGINRRVRDSDSDGSMFSDSDSDGHDDDNIKRNVTRDNGRPQGRRMNNFGRQNENGSARRGEFRSSDRTSNRVNSFAHSRDDSFSRGSGGDGYAGRRNDNFQHFDSLEDGNRNRGRGNNFRGGSRGGRRDERGSSNNLSGGSRGGRREERGSSNNFSDRSRGERRDERGSSYNFSDRSRGERRDERGSSNNFSDRSRGERRDERGTSNNFSDRSRGGRNRGGGDGFRNETGDNFSGRNRRFVQDDNGDDNRPRRRIIER